MLFFQRSTHCTLSLDMRWSRVILTRSWSCFGWTKTDNMNCTFFNKNKKSDLLTEFISKYPNNQHMKLLKNFHCKLSTNMGIMISYCLNFKNNSNLKRSNLSNKFNNSKNQSIIFSFNIRNYWWKSQHLFRWAIVWKYHNKTLSSHFYNALSQVSRKLLSCC